MASTWALSWGVSWGVSWDIPTPPPVVVTTTQGMGPGWNLFGQPHHAAKRPDRSREEIEAVIREAYDRATDTDTAQERKRAVVALKRVAAEQARAADAAGHVALAQQLSDLRKLQINATKYLDAMGAILAKARAEEEAKLAAMNDDDEALMLIMELM